MSLALPLDPGGPRQTRSPSCRTCSPSIFSPLTYVPVALPPSDSTRPRALLRTCACAGSTFPRSSWRSASELAPRLRVASESSISQQVPSSCPPVTTSVGLVTAEEESLTALRPPRGLETLDL